MAESRTATKSTREIVLPRSSLRWRYDWRYFESDLRAALLLLGSIFGWVLLAVVVAVAAIVLMVR